MGVTRWRRLSQAVSAALFILPPLVRTGGRSLVLLDLPRLRFFLAGRVLGIEDLYLLWFAAGGFLFAFLLAATVLGRAWCGWACPQTWFLNAGDLIRKKTRGTATSAAVRHLLFILMAAACGFVFTAWFIDARTLAARIMRLAPGPWPGGTITAVTVIAWLDLVLIKRVFCRDFCPYGRIQAALSLPATLLVGIPAAEMARCIDCRSCIKSCPMGIDIRDGLQIACINCGECIDACRTVMGRRGGEGLVAYRFGNESARDALLNPRVLIAALFLTVCLTALFWQAGHPPGADLAVRRLAGIRPRVTAKGEVSHFFDARIRNRGKRSGEFHLTVTGPGVRLAGNTKTGTLPPGGNTTLRFVLVTGRKTGGKARITLADEDGRELAAVRVTVPETASQP